MSQEQLDVGAEAQDGVTLEPKYPLPKREPKLALVPPKEGYVIGNGETRKVVVPEEVYRLAKLGCSDTEIADWFGVVRQSLVRHFQAELDKGRAEMKQELRRAQIHYALGGNATLLIWLGKNMLSQTDAPQPQTEQDGGVEFAVTILDKAKVEQKLKEELAEPGEASMVERGVSDQEQE